MPYYLAMPALPIDSQPAASSLHPRSDGNLEEEPPLGLRHKYPVYTPIKTLICFFSKPESSSNSFSVQPYSSLASFNSFAAGLQVFRSVFLNFLSELRRRIIDRGSAQCPERKKKTPPQPNRLRFSATILICCHQFFGPDFFSSCKKKAAGKRHTNLPFS